MAHGSYSTVQGMQGTRTASPSRVPFYIPFYLHSPGSAAKSDRGVAPLDGKLCAGQEFSALEGIADQYAVGTDGQEEIDIHYLRMR